MTDAQTIAYLDELLRDAKTSKKINQLFFCICLTIACVAAIVPFVIGADLLTGKVPSLSFATFSSLFGARFKNEDRKVRHKISSLTFLKSVDSSTISEHLLKQALKEI